MKNASAIPPWAITAWPGIFFGTQGGCFQIIWHINAAKRPAFVPKQENAGISRPGIYSAVAAYQANRAAMSLNTTKPPLAGLARERGFSGSAKVKFEKGL